MNIFPLFKLTRYTLFLPFVFSLTLIACSDAENSNSTSLDPNWDAEIKMRKVTDINNDENIVEVNIEALEKEVELQPGATTNMYTYNGVTPGPIIEAKVGDTLIVHFTNNLPEPSTIHWHGVELPALMDGSNISQQAVAANGGTFTYQFKLLKAATYWYHPHIQTHRQIELGLYGALVVRDPEEDQRLDLPQQELVLMLDDILLDANSQVEKAYPDDPVSKADTQLNGREGNLLLVNGRAWPNTVDVEIGKPIRLRMINAANARFFRVDVPGHLMFRIGGDTGLISRPLPAFPVDSVDNTITSLKTGIQARDAGDVQGIISNPDLELGVMMVPGERTDVVFTPKGEPGEFAYLVWHDFRRGKHGIVQNGDGSYSLTHGYINDGTAEPQKLIRFRLTGQANKESNAFIPPTTLKFTNAIDASNPDGVLPVTFGHSLPDENGDVIFFASMVDGVGKPFEQLQPEEALQANVGGTYIWEVKNLTEGDHPFHPHGFSFQLLETEYVDLDTPENNFIVKANRVENKDTIRVPGRPGAVRGRSWTTMRLVSIFDDNGREGQVAANGKLPTDESSGGWIVHCHILEHANRGMMTFLNLYEQ